jgi:hypothetical protein
MENHIKPLQWRTETCTTQYEQNKNNTTRSINTMISNILHKNVITLYKNSIISIYISRYNVRISYMKNGPVLGEIPWSEVNKSRLRRSMKNTTMMAILQIERAKDLRSAPKYNQRIRVPYTMTKRRPILKLRIRWQVKARHGQLPWWLTYKKDHDNAGSTENNQYLQADLARQWSKTVSWITIPWIARYVSFIEIPWAVQERAMVNWSTWCADNVQYISTLSTWNNQLLRWNKLRSEFYCTERFYYQWKTLVPKFGRDLTGRWLRAMVRLNEKALFPPLGKKSGLPHVEVGTTSDSQSGRKNTTTNVETRRVQVLQNILDTSDTIQDIE